MMLMLIIIPEILLMMTVRAEMMMIKTGESAALECEGDWKYCEWRHHEKVGIDSEKSFMPHLLSSSRNFLVTEP